MKKQKSSSTLLIIIISIAIELYYSVASSELYLIVLMSGALISIILIGSGKNVSESLFKEKEFFGKITGIIIVFVILIDIVFIVKSSSKDWSGSTTGIILGSFFNGLLIIFYKLKKKEKTEKFILNFWLTKIISAIYSTICIILFFAFILLLALIDFSDGLRSKIRIYLHNQWGEV